MKQLILVVLLAVLAPSVFAQTIQGQVTNAVVLPSNPVISFCNAPANGVPCTNKATTYTSAALTAACPSNAQIVLDGTTTCVASPDAQNNWGVWAPPGQYTYTVAAGGNNFGPYYVTLPVTGAGFTATGASTFSAGIVTANLISANPNPATSGFARLAATDSQCWKSALGGADLCLTKNALDVFLLNGSAILTGTMSSGTVTSFSAGNLSPLFTASVATSTTTPALSFTLTNQSPNLFFAGPPSGGSAVPTFRAAVSADIPAINLAAAGNGGVTGTLPVGNGGTGTTTSTGSGSVVLATSPTITTPSLTTPALTTPTIGGGSTITRYNVITSSSLTWSSIGLGATSSQSQTITGVQASDRCMVLAWGQAMGGSNTSAYVASIRVTGTNTVVFDWTNPFGSSQTPVSGTVTLLCLQ